MIIITHVEVMQVPYSSHELRSFQPGSRVPVGKPGEDFPFEEVQVLSEMINGRTFVPEDGAPIVLGCSGQAANAIGIMWDAWANQDAMINGLRQRAENLKRDVETADAIVRAYREDVLRLEKAGVILRLKWLFTGVNS